MCILKVSVNLVSRPVLKRFHDCVYVYQIHTFCLVAIGSTRGQRDWRRRRRGVYQRGTIARIARPGDKRTAKLQMFNDREPSDTRGQHIRRRRCVGDHRTCQRSERLCLSLLPGVEGGSLHAAIVVRLMFCCIQ